MFTEKKVNIISPPFFLKEKVHLNLCKLKPLYSNSSCFSFILQTGNWSKILMTVPTNVLPSFLTNLLSLLYHSLEVFIHLSLKLFLRLGSMTLFRPPAIAGSYSISSLLSPLHILSLSMPKISPLLSLYTRIMYYVWIKGCWPKG